MSPYGVRLISIAVVLSMVPSVACSTGNDFSNNLFTDLSPLLALFGEQVTKQFLSDAMGWADYILFAMVPLGIITAMVSAIRCGGPRWLKAIVGRAKESRAMVELELMSSTSADVCELWNGHNIVRVIGSPSIMEIFYLEDLHGNGDHGVYLSNEMDYDTYYYRFRKLKVPYQEDIAMNDFRGNGEESPQLLDFDELPPNITLNVHGSGISSKEIWTWSFFGIALQLGLLAFAGYSSLYHGLGDTFHLGDDKQEPVPVWAVALVFVGTLALIAGMALCCNLIDKSSGEEWFKVDLGVNLVWLQRGGAVGEQNFGSYAIFAKTRQKFVKSHRNTRIDNPPPSFRNLVILAVFLSFSGFVVQFVGMRNLHWSFPVAQLGCTILMTAIRAWVRRSLFLEPTAKEIEPGCELDFLARSIGGCEPWSLGRNQDSIKETQPGTEDEIEEIQPGTEDGIKEAQQGIEPKHQAIISRVFSVRKRLGILSSWGSHLEGITLSLSKAINGVMKTLYESEHIILKDTSESEVFTWDVRIHTEASRGSENYDGLVGKVPLRIERKKTANSSSITWGDWTVNQGDLEALLSLLLEKRTIEVKAQSSRAPTYWRFPFDYHNAWERQIFKWWAKNQNLSTNSWLQAELSTTGPDGAIWLPVLDFGVSCAQEIFVGFFSEVVGNLIKHIGGPVELQLAEGSGLCTFGLKCDVLDSLVEIVRGSGLGTHEESFISIIGPLASHWKLPEPRLVIPDIYKRLRDDPTLRKSPDIEEFIFYIFKAQIIQYLRREKPDWESAARFLIEELQKLVAGPKVTIPTHLKLMLMRLFRQAAPVLTESSGMSKLWEEAYTNKLVDIPGISPSLTLQNGKTTIPYPAVVSGELCMLHEFLSTTPDNRSEIIPELLKAAVDVGYDSVVDLILSVGTDRMFTTAELHALENSFKKAASSSNDILIDIFATHLYVFGATKSLRFEEINAEEVICELLSRGFSSVQKLLISSDIHFSNKLQVAAGSGYFNVVELILDSGADINALASGVYEVKIGTQVFLRRDRGTALQAAARGGHLDVVKLLIGQKANVNTGPAENYGRTALQAAARGGHVDVVKLLLDQKADVNAKPAENHGRTALQAAAEGGHFGVVKLLLEQKAKVNASPGKNDGRTALQAAAEGGHLDVVQLLLDRGANIDQNYNWSTAPQAVAEGDYPSIIQLSLYRITNINRNYRGGTALQVAAEGGHPNVVQLLLDRGANVNLIYGRRTALQAAAEGGHFDVVQLLLDRGANVNTHTEGLTALYAAAGGGHFDVVRLLLDRGANVNPELVENYGQLELQGVVTDFSFYIVQLLLNKIINTNIRYSGRTALQAAAKGGYFDVVQLLLDRGANLNIHDNRQTALDAAAGGGHLDVVQLLLGREANVNTETARNYGRTALRAAARGGHLDVVQLLLDRRSNASTNYNWKTVLQVAIGGSCLFMLQVFINRMANASSWQTAIQAATGDHLDVVRLRLGREAKDMRVALQGAARGGHFDVVKLLLDKGANVNAEPAGFYRRTALRAAAEGGNLDVVQLLFDRRANTNTNYKWQTALHEAIEDYEAGIGVFFDIFQLSLDPSANTNIGYSGRTALQAAAKGGHLDVVQLLLDQGANVNAGGINVNAGLMGIYGETALQAAVRGSHLGVTRLLLEGGADVNTKPDSSGRTLLKIAAWHKNRDLVQLLRLSGARELGPLVWGGEAEKMRRR